MTGLTRLLASTALVALVAGPASADDNPVSRFFDRVANDVSKSVSEARASGWRNEVRGRDDDDRDDDDDDDDRGGRDRDDDDDDDDDDRGGDDDDDDD